MWILLIIYAFMGIGLCIHLHHEMKWEAGDCLFAAIFWPIVLLWAYIKYLNNNG